MAKSKIKKTESISSSKRIKKRPVPNDNITFNFKHLFEHENKFVYSEKDNRYFCSLLNRIKEISRYSVSDLMKNQQIKDSLRHHPIDFSKTNVSEDSFGIKDKEGEEVIESAWQFSISSNEHGRFHGFYIDTTFYVVWLDPDHELYPGQ